MSKIIHAGLPDKEYAENITRYILANQWECRVCRSIFYYDRSDLGTQIDFDNVVALRNSKKGPYKDIYGIITFPTFSIPVEIACPVCGRVTEESIPDQDIISDGILSNMERAKTKALRSC